MKLLIVDDEYHVRVRLSTKIDWQSLGVDEIVLCDDGDLALDEIHRQKIDILLTDLKMPRMDGITLAKSALLYNPTIKIIIMSAYDDKNFLKSAIDLHVVGYLEKPFSLDQVKSTVKDAVNMLHSALLTQAESNLSRQLHLSKAAFALCRYTTHMDEIEQQLSDKAPDFLTHPFYFTILADYCGDENDSIQDSVSFEYESLFTLMNDIQIDALISLQKDQIILFQIGFDSKEDMVNISNKLYQVLLPLLSSSDLFLSVGSVVTTHHQLYHSYQEAVICKEQHFYFAESVLYVHSITGRIYNFSIEELLVFKTHLLDKNSEACYQYVENLRQLLIDHSDTLVREVKNYYFKLILIILSEIPSFKTFMDSIPEHCLWDILYHIDTLDKLHKYTTELLDSYFSTTIPETSQMSIDTILVYIHDHYSDPELSLNSISKAHYMSVPYLCMYFKERTKKTIKSYIISCRMNRAKDLLLTSDLKISEISERVGFTDQNYFTKSFSKYFGMPPSKYKEHR